MAARCCPCTEKELVVFIVFVLGRSIHVFQVIRKELGVARTPPQCLMLVFSLVLHFSHAVTCPAPVVSSVPTSSSCSSPSTSLDNSLDSIHQSNLPLSSVPSWDASAANISPVNSAMLPLLSSIMNVSVSLVRSPD